MMFSPPRTPYSSTKTCLAMWKMVFSSISFGTVSCFLGRSSLRVRILFRLTTNDLRLTTTPIFLLFCFSCCKLWVVGRSSFPDRHHNIEVILQKRGRLRIICAKGGGARAVIGEKEDFFSREGAHPFQNIAGVEDYRQGSASLECFYRQKSLVLAGFLGL